MAKKKSAEPESPNLTAFKALLDGTEGVELKGAKSKYSSVNGNMFCFITQEGKLALRLSKEDQEKFLSEHRDSLCIQYGAVMRGYVEVPESIMQNKRRLRALFQKCCENAFALPPKATTRKKK